jgi:hypothetical protein
MEPPIIHNPLAFCGRLVPQANRHQGRRICLCGRLCRSASTERIGGANVRLRAGYARRQRAEHRRLARRVRNEMKRVHRPALSDAIDAADSLLESHRVPWQLEVDDDTTRALQVQAFTRSVRGEQHGRAAIEKRRERGPSCIACEAAVENGAVDVEQPAQVEERVAILGEDNCWFVAGVQCPQQAFQAEHLGFAPVDLTRGHE